MAGLSEDRVRALVEEDTGGRGLGVLGYPSVNVLKLDVAEDRAVFSVDAEACLGGRARPAPEVVVGEFVGPGAYPIVPVAYEVVCERGTRSKSLDLVKAFLRYAAGEDGQRAASRLGHSQLPERIRDRAMAAIDALA
ncbi:hypothetical protein BLA60_27875 [Actinophytocola xinjiangensis]|uniref:Uncharacterized protein n=1 Tax=Actinophytocola xinjiangensis TaxID=485602 RepID=A0A7Z1AX77_9PSEU|nr:potassium-transporting ATPase subunit C [Actinophytocola xinjiangensis]OLF07386.1 hypothetical protein BLA60_27875 [Actinophytocola xinjiangensis]